MKNFNDLNEVGRVFLTHYIDRFLRRFGHIPDAPEIPITDILLRLKRRHFRYAESGTPSIGWYEPHEPDRALYAPMNPVPFEPDIDLFDVREVSERPRVVIVGESGTGRTTTLRFIAMNLAVKLDKDFDLSGQSNGDSRYFDEFEPQISPDTQRLPIFVSLDGVTEEQDVENLVLNALKDSLKGTPREVRSLLKDREFLNGILNDWPITVFFDSIDVVNQSIAQKLFYGIDEFSWKHPNAHIIVSMRPQDVRKVNLEQLYFFMRKPYWFYELLPLSELEFRLEFAELWLENLKKIYPHIQPPDPLDILDVIAEKHRALRNALERHLMLQTALELSTLGGIKALEKVRSRSELYSFRVNAMFYKALQRLGALEIEKVRWTDDGPEFVYNPADGVFVEKIESLRAAIFGALQKLASEMEQKGGIIEKREGEKVARFKSIGQLIAEIGKQVDSGSRKWPLDAFVFLSRDMELLRKTDKSMIFTRKTYFHYFLAQRLLEQWRNGKEKAWSRVLAQFKEHDIRDLLLFFAGSLKKEELEKILETLIKAEREEVRHQEQEDIFSRESLWQILMEEKGKRLHLNILAAALMIGEVDYRGSLRDEVVSLMPNWQWAWSSGWRSEFGSFSSDGVIWRDAVIAMDYPQPIISEMIETIEDVGKQDLHKDALEALAQLGFRDEKLIQRIIEKEDEDDFPFKERISYLIGLLKIDNPDAVEKVKALIEDDDSDVVKLAIWALGRLSVHDVNTIRKIVSKIRENSLLADTAISALLQIATKNPDAVLQAVLKLMEDESPEVHQKVLDFLVKFMKLRGKDPHLIQVILKETENQNDHVRERAIRAFVELGVREPDVISKIFEKVDDESPRIRRRAIEALADFGIKSADVVQKIVEKLEDDHPEVRAAAVEAVGKLGIKDSEVVKKIVERLEDEVNYVRYTAIDALDELGVRDRDVIKKIVERVGDENDMVRSTAAETLVKWRVRDPEIIQMIKEKTRDKDPFVRGEAENLLKRLESGDKE